MSRLREFIRNLSPNALLLVLLALWWMLNIIVAATVELANDEAYYWFFSWKLDWGYYDHPPMTPLLIWLGRWIPRELGVRFFAVLLQPIYLFLFWRLIKPKNPTQRDAWLYFLIAFSIPLLQLYGFLTTPDTPLMMFTALFLCCFTRFCRNDSWKNMTLLGLSIALLAYSKYHSVLVVALALAACPRCFRSPKLYISLLITLLLYLPHLIWQYEHDWVSFQYHLVGRNQSFKASYLGHYLLNTALVFNPLFLYHYILGWRKRNSDNAPMPPVLKSIAIGFLGFFFLSCFRGPTQPQWIIPVVFSALWLLFNLGRDNEKAYRFIRSVGLVSIALFLVGRLLLITNPFHFKGQVWNNEDCIHQLEEVAQGRPVIFINDYTAAAKYYFYSSRGDAFTQPLLYNRTSQWAYTDIDDSFVGKEVIVQRLPRMECKEDKPEDPFLKLANGTTFRYRVVEDFHPYRKVKVTCLDSGRIMGDSISFSLRIENPYPYPICSAENRPVWLQLFLKQSPTSYRTTDYIISDPLPSNSITERTILFPTPENLAPDDYPAQIALRDSLMLPWRNSQIMDFHVSAM